MEIKKIQAPVEIKAHDLQKGSVLVINKYLSASLSHLDLYWEVSRNGIPVESARLPLPNVTARKSEIMDIPYTILTCKTGEEYHLNLTLRLNHAQSWAEYGHEIYQEQYELPFSEPYRPQELGAGGRIHLSSSTNQIELTGEQFSVVFDRQEGLISSYVSDGQLLISTGMLENFYRAPTGIDVALAGRQSIDSVWKEYGLDRLERRDVNIQAIQVDETRVDIEVNCRLTAAGMRIGFNSCLRYSVFGDGTIKVEHSVRADSKLPMLPRIGTTLTMPERFGALAWFGRGPHENYIDRKLSATIGLYTSTVDDQNYPYIVPVECGGKEDVRWLEITDSKGKGIRIGGEVPFHFNIHRNSVADYSSARHPFDLQRSESVWLNIDHLHSGLGGDNGWSSNVHPEYQISPGVYRYSFFIKPL